MRPGVKKRGAFWLSITIDCEIIKMALSYVKANGMLPFFWDTGGALDRQNYSVKDQRTIAALNAGAN